MVTAATDDVKTHLSFHRSRLRLQLLAAMALRPQLAAASAARPRQKPHRGFLLSAGVGHGRKMGKVEKFFTCNIKLDLYTASFLYVLAKMIKNVWFYLCHINLSILGREECFMFQLSGAFLYLRD